MSTLDRINQAMRALRKAQYDIVKALNLGGPRLVSEGDSWFQHPIEIDIIDALSCAVCGYKIRSLGGAGDLLGDMLEQREFVPAIQEEQPEAFLFSGGGNDLIGDGLAQSLRRVNGATHPEQCIDRDRLDKEIGRLETMYRDIHALVQGVKPGLPMIVHGYAYARPGKRYYILLLDWGLGDTLQNGGVPRNLWDGVVKIMIDRLNVMLADLSISLDHLYHVDLREAVRREDFVDELHLNSSAAVRVARKFDSVIQRAIGRQREGETWT